MKSNPSVYKKFNKNMLEGVATRYELSQVKAEVRKNDLRINSEYMEAIGEHILRIVEVDPNWLVSFSDSFTGHLDKPDSADANPSLQLLSGTASKLLLICSQQFLTTLLSLLYPKLSLTHDSSNRIFILSILKNLLSNCILNFTPLSNVFIEWFYDRIKDNNKKASTISL